MREVTLVPMRIEMVRDENQIFIGVRVRLLPEGVRHETETNQGFLDFYSNDVHMINEFHPGEKVRVTFEREEPTQADNAG